MTDQKDFDENQIPVFSGLDLGAGYSYSPNSDGFLGESPIKVAREVLSETEVELIQKRLKAYWVEQKDAEWGLFIHAESVSSAKSIFVKEYPFLDSVDWTDIRATRTLGADLLDVTPFTDYTLQLAGYTIPNSDEFEPMQNAFLDTCPCEMCKAELKKEGVK